MKYVEWLEATNEMYSPIDFIVIFDNLDRFWFGLSVTLQLTIIPLVLGTLIALPLAVARSRGHPALSRFVWFYTYIFRGTPLLVQTYLIYFGLGQFSTIRESFLWGSFLSNAWWCALIAFTLNTTAYTTELLRGAIESLPKGELDAAKACGLSSFQQLRRIVLPSAFRRALPAYSNEVIFMLHSSAVASTITLQDILGVGRWLNGRYYLAYEGFVTAAVFYMILALLINRGFQLWEQQWLAHLRPKEDVKRPAGNGLISFRW